MDRLTPHQDRFVTEYLICLDATESARRAGYAHPNKTGPRTYHIPHVKAAIEAALEERRKANRITAERVIEELTKVALAELNGGAGGIRGSDKVNALNTLAKHFGLLIDRTEITGRDGAPLSGISADMTPEQANEAYAKLLN